MGGSRRQGTYRRWGSGGGNLRERRREKKTTDRWRHSLEQGKLSEGTKTMLYL